MTKTEPAYWEGRLFQNTYTYKDQTRRVRGWAVKIQHDGRRKTFSLKSSQATQAAKEACRLYRDVISIGWEAVTRTRRKAAFEPLQASTWAQRLVHRPYSMEHPGSPDRELFVRIEHEGVAHYCPLGTARKEAGEHRAVRLFRHITTHGWPAARMLFPRELAVAFHWMDNPLVWTYTTIHTLLEPALGEGRFMAHAAASHGRVDIAVVEPDPGIRQALSWCIRQTEGYRCTIAVARISELLRRLTSRSAHLVLLNTDQQAGHRDNTFFLHPPDRPPATLWYSVSNDSEDLFKNAPGGARFYFLHRTSATRFLEPLGDRLIQGPLSNTELASISQSYFRKLFGSMPGSSQEPHFNLLSPREQQVLSHLSKGLVEKEIALDLQISAHTVHQHIRNIFEKLGVHSKVEAVLKFLQK